MAALDAAEKAAPIRFLQAELNDLLRGLALVRELTPRTLDLVASYGERWSCRGIAQYFGKHGIPAVAVDAYDLGLRTDSRFMSANPDPTCFPEVRKGLKAIKGKVPVVTGFIAKDGKGDVTTLGRSGSDFSATLLGAAIKADEVQIWTDVDGVMTSDPRIVKEAKSIPVLSIAEASELAHYGAKVIHPATMLPAIENRIPVVVKNTARPEVAGTTILADDAVRTAARSAWSISRALAKRARRSRASAFSNHASSSSGSSGRAAVGRTNIASSIAK